MQALLRRAHKIASKTITPSFLRCKPSFFLKRFQSPFPKQSNMRRQMLGMSKPSFFFENFSLYSNVLFLLLFSYDFIKKI